jgi:cytochrome P450
MVHGHGEPDVAEPANDVNVLDMMGGLDPATAAVPQPLYRSLVETTPVLRIGSSIILSGRAQIDEAFRCPEVFSSNSSAADLGNIRPLIPLQIDPPDHVKFRRLLDPLFAPRQMAKLEPQIAALVHRLVDRFIDRGECDLVSEFTIPLPSEVFLTLFGLPLEELDTFLAMKDGIIRPPGRTSEEQNEKRRTTAAEIYAYFEQILEERARDPREDLLSGFLTAEIDGERLSREDIEDICFLLMIAGLDTVTASLDCFFSYLARNAPARARLVEDPALIPAAVEEMLRFETPVAGVPRVAVADSELSGVPIHAGDQVMLILGAANVDEAEFAAAMTVDFGRGTNRHLAFGGGIHRCLGSHLARQELRVALREFHTRIPDYRLAPDAELVYTPAIRSLASLPLVFGN